jgi:hypothetical protein
MYRPSDTKWESALKLAGPLAPLLSLLALLLSF